MRWQEFAARQPVLAEIATRKLTGPAVVLVATIRRDGALGWVRSSRCCGTGDLGLSMGLGSRKATDLPRDARILVHSIVTSRKGEESEYRLRGVAVQESRAANQARYAREVAARLRRRPDPQGRVWCAARPVPRAALTVGCRGPGGRHSSDLPNDASDATPLI
jgi:hypothetical protein